MIASETKEEEEKEEEELSLVSTKVPKARVRFSIITRRGAAKECIRICFSLGDEFSLERTLTFVFPLFFFLPCVLHHARRRG